MNKIFLPIICILASSFTMPAFSFGEINPAAYNMMRYQQSANMYNRRNTRQALPYVYSPQQARYYGINVANPNNQYRQYGLYQQNYQNRSQYGMW